MEKRRRKLHDTAVYFGRCEVASGLNLNEVVEPCEQQRSVKEGGLAIAILCLPPSAPFEEGW